MGIGKEEAGASQVPALQQSGEEIERQEQPIQQIQRNKRVPKRKHAPLVLDEQPYGYAMQKGRPRLACSQKAHARTFSACVLFLPLHVAWGIRIRMLVQCDETPFDRGGQAQGPCKPDLRLPFLDFDMA